MSKRKRGRPEINTITINRQLFDAALKHQNISMAKLSKHPSIDVNEKTIRRIRQNEQTNPEMLKAIAKVLNVDTFWLTGQTLEIMPWFKYNEKYMNPANNPYNKYQEERKLISADRVYKDLLVLHGILDEDFSLLSENEAESFKMELELLIKIAIFSHFGPHISKDNPFLSNPELIALSKEALSSDACQKLFELIMI